MTLINGWERLTACLMLGALASDDLENAKAAMIEAIESFSPAGLPTDSDMLAALAGDYGKRAQAILEVELSPGHHHYNGG